MLILFLCRVSHLGYYPKVVTMCKISIAQGFPFEMVPYLGQQLSHMSDHPSWATRASRLCNWDIAVAQPECPQCVTGINWFCNRNIIIVGLGCCSFRMQQCYILLTKRAYSPWIPLCCLVDGVVACKFWPEFFLYTNITCPGGWRLCGWLHSCFFNQHLPWGYPRFTRW